jgi:HlyD family secretion protein
MSRTTGRRARAAYALGALVALATTACTAEPPPPPTLRVDRGTVATSVSASGTLVAISEQNLGFPDGGQLVELAVEVGTQVEPGQVLAKVDDFELRQTLEQQQANLAQQQAELDRARNGNSLNATGRTLDQAKEILEAVKKQAHETNELNRSATERAREQLEFDREVLDRAEDQLRRDKDLCDDEPEDPQTQSIAPAPGETPSDESRGTEDTEGDADEGGGNDDNDNSDDEDGARVTGASFAVPTQNAACDRIPSDKTAVESAERSVISSETALDAAKHQEDVDEASGRVSIEREKQNVVAAENDRGSAKVDQPADIRAQEAVVRDARAAVAIAQRDVDNTVLKAPVRGVVSVINGRVGEYLGAASGTTPLAPGSTAALPGSTDLSSGNGGGGAGATGGGAFMVLNNIDSFQLVVPFEESDAARVAPNQQVEVTVDAIPDLRAPATVLSIAPSGNQSSGIVEYYATIVLREGSDPRLRDGQTALADVLVESQENVLRVPTAAVRRDATGTVVDVRGEDGRPVPTPFQAGAVGDEYTEVVSGLREGQELLLPQPAA